MAVPAESDLLVEVTSEGYQGWVYTDAANSSRPLLRLASGEGKVLEIEVGTVADNLNSRDVRFPGLQASSWKESMDGHSSNVVTNPKDLCGNAEPNFSPSQEW
jgi:hypothetical protein